MKRAHPFQRRVLNFIHQEQLISAKDSILAAVSGGPDSLALLHVLVTLREICGIGPLTVLHFDHQLRGMASAEDRAFVEALAETFGLPFHGGSADVRSYQRSHRISLEMAARVCRHRFFQEASSHLQANRLALGHSANDQAEEVLLRLFRGAGPSGMSGMPSKTTDGFIRPLLFATREEILRYLHDQKLSFREDPSNLDMAHQRNAVRHRVLPVVRNHFHQKVVDVLCRNARLVADEESYWKEMLANLWPTLCFEETPSRIVIRCRDLIDLHPALRRRALRMALERLRGNLQGVYAVHIESLCRLVAGKASGRSVQLHGGLRAMIEGETLVFFNESPGASPGGVLADDSQTMNGPGRYPFSFFELRLSIRAGLSAIDARLCRETPDTVRLDAGAIRWPLFLRSWKNGDRFHPFGLSGSKKLQDFFVDCKIARSRRSQVPLLCDQEKICWVVGHRLDDRVKVTPQTEQVLVIERSTQHPGLSTQDSGPSTQDSI